MSKKRSKKRSAAAYRAMDVSHWPTFTFIWWPKQSIGRDGHRIKPLVASLE